MNDLELAQQIMDDDGAGSAITSVPAQVRQVGRYERQAVRDILARRYGQAIPVTDDMVDAVMHS